MKHRLFTLFVLLAMLFSASGVTPVRADSTITVITTLDTIAIDGACTLREAINNANSDSDTTSGDCTAGSGNDTILFASGLGAQTITLASTLPDINDSDGLTIDGDNRITLSGNDSVRVLYVSGTLTLQNISVTHGSAGNGSGLYNNSGTVIITHSAFSNNNATGSGGGVMNNGGTLTITKSTFSNNSASAEGGGVANYGTLTIVNSTFAGNSASYGGGVSNNSATATLLNSTFSGNTATTMGGAVFINHGGTPAPVTTIYNSILANSTASQDCYNYAPSGTLAGGNNIIETTAGGGGASSCSPITASTADPMLGSLTGAPAYFPLNYGSPALDTGNDAFCPATDQRGAARPQGVHCDIGAYEKLQITVNSTADNATASDGACTLREAIDNANNDWDATSGDCATGSGYDIILFNSSLGTATITLASTLPDITDSAGLTIDGDNRVTLSGNDSVRVLYVSGGASGGGFTLQNISVTHGNISTASGGGLYNTNGKVTITHSVFSNNSSTNNSGGGAVNSGSLATMTISHSTFSNNSAANDGGGVVNGSGAVLTIANSTFLDNSANYGGGVQNINSTLTLLNSTFSGNSAASGTGAAVGTWNNAAMPSTTIYNTILANSVTGVDCWNHATGVLIGTNNIIETSGSGSNGCSTIAVSAADPMLGSLTGSPAYFPLTLGSPAIDAGDDAVCAAAPVNNESQNGVTRPQGAHCDIGSYEKVPNSAPTDITLSPSSVTENQPAGAKVGTLTTSDPDVTDTHTYSFACTIPGADDASFQIGGAGNNELHTAAVFDYETKNTYNICLRTDDGNGGTFDKAFTVNVTDMVETVVATLRSMGDYDGWVLESAENSNAGGMMDSAATTFRLGDDNLKKQYRGILSFSTGAGLPDTAVITKVTLKVKKQGITGGGDPIATFQGFMLDIKKGFFGTAALQTSDFQTAASKTYGPFLTALGGGWYSIDLTPGKGYINKMSTLSGLTQIRLRFKLDDNNNAVANYLSLFSGNAPAASRPQLIIEYYIP